MNETLIRSMYKTTDIPVDTLVRTPAVLSEFTSEYNKTTGECVTDAEMGRHLKNMGRKGEAKGGLPRLRRPYYGRN